MRRITNFRIENETCVGTLDAAAGTTGLLLVTGGNEVRSGAHRGQSLLAQRLAAAGHPVFRYDRRGVGDSTGQNRGFEGSAPDIAAAAAHFRALQPQLTVVVALGNCDAATALALFHADAAIDRLVLTNPWTIEQPDAGPPPAAIRARYAAKLKDPRAWWRLLRGGVDLGKLAGGLRQAGKRPEPSGLAARLSAAIAGAAIPVTILLAERDNTAVAFRSACPDLPVTSRATASHSFAAEGDADWLLAKLLKILR